MTTKAADVASRFKQAFSKAGIHSFSHSTSATSGPFEKNEDIEVVVLGVRLKGSIECGSFQRMFPAQIYLRDPTSGEDWDCCERSTAGLAGSVKSIQRAAKYIVEERRIQQLQTGFEKKYKTKLAYLEIDFDKKNKVGLNIGLDLTEEQFVIFRELLDITFEKDNLARIADLFKEGRVSALLVSDVDSERELGKKIMMLDPTRYEKKKDRIYTKPEHLKFVDEVKKLGEEPEYFAKPGWDGPIILTKDLQKIIRQTTVDLRWETQGDLIRVRPAN